MTDRCSQCQKFIGKGTTIEVNIGNPITETILYCKLCWNMLNKPEEK